jgi:hypothetical protein
MFDSATRKRAHLFTGVLMCATIGVGLSGHARAASTWSSPVAPPPGCSRTPMAVNAAGNLVTAYYF